MAVLSIQFCEKSMDPCFIIRAILNVTLLYCTFVNKILSKIV